MVGFAAVYADTTRRVVLHNKAFIHTAKMTAIKINLKEVHKRWVKYKEYQSYMHSIDYKKENHRILNQICDILTELQTQGT